jgi:Cytidylate kinase-like family
MHSREQALRTAEAFIRSSEYACARRPSVPPQPSFTIALSREAGSGGKLIAREVGRRLNWPVYDYELLDHLATELQVDVDQLESVDE